MKKIFSIITLGALLFAGSAIADELEESIAVHGGLDTFKSYGTLDYDHEVSLGDRLNLKDNQLIDLKSRKILITSEDFKLGFDGNEVWVVPSMEALGVPARFYSSTTFYFFGLPFLFADPGVNAQSLGIKEVNGKEYKVVKFTYDAGVGDTPDDDYIAYFDKETNRLDFVTYIVTYPPLMRGKSKEELPRRTAFYEQWQEAGGLTVPKKITFHAWEDDKVGEESYGYMLFEDVTFEKQSPDPSVFEKPEGAQIDNSHLAK